MHDELFSIEITWNKDKHVKVFAILNSVMSESNGGALGDQQTDTAPPTAASQIYSTKMIKLRIIDVPSRRLPDDTERLMLSTFFMWFSVASHICVTLCVCVHCVIYSIFTVKRVTSTESYFNKSIFSTKITLIMSESPICFKFYENCAFDSTNTFTHDSRYVDVKIQITFRFARRFEISSFNWYQACSAFGYGWHDQAAIIHG